MTMPSSTLTKVPLDLDESTFSLTSTEIGVEKENRSFQDGKSNQVFLTPIFALMTAESDPMIQSPPFLIQPIETQIIDQTTPLPTNLCFPYLSSEASLDRWEERANRFQLKPRSVNVLRMKQETNDSPGI